MVRARGENTVAHALALTHPQGRAFTFRAMLLSLLRYAHILGAILLLGNVIVSGVWATIGMRRDSGMTPRAVARAVILADWWLTVPGGALLTTAGVAMAHFSARPLWGTPFTRHGLIALAISTALWLAVLVPLQRRWVRARDDAEARRLFLWWSVVGWSATGALLYGLGVMVFRSYFAV
jgi:uncharacterized membrane protein